VYEFLVLENYLKDKHPNYGISFKLNEFNNEMNKLLSSDEEFLPDITLSVKINGELNFIRDERARGMTYIYRDWNNNNPLIMIKQDYSSDKVMRLLMARINSLSSFQGKEVCVTLLLLIQL